MLKFVYFLIIVFVYNSLSIAMENKSYHHLPDGTFRNPEGSPKRDENIKWSFRTFNKEKKKLKIEIPSDHVINSDQVLQDLETNKSNDYVAWLGHATFLIKLGDTTIITDPLFSKNSGPLIFGPKRYVDSAIKLNELPKTDLFLLTHNHYDHLDYSTIKNFPYKKSKVIIPLKLSKYFTKNEFKDVNELDWYKRSLTDTNKTLWGSFLIEYKDKKIFFACDTGYGNIYKVLGEKYGPIDLTFINIGAYDFRPMFD